MDRRYFLRLESPKIKGDEVVMRVDSGERIQTERVNQLLDYFSERHLTDICEFHSRGEDFSDSTHKHYKSLLNDRGVLVELNWGSYVPPAEKIVNEYGPVSRTPGFKIHRPHIETKIPARVYTLRVSFTGTSNRRELVKLAQEVKSLLMFKNLKRDTSPLVA